MREKDREKPTGCSLTLSDVVAAAAVIFPSGGNKVTLACARTGDRRSGRLRRWRRPLLTRAGVSRGDRSEELLTGGPWHTHSTCPGRCSVSTSFHRKLEWESREGEKLSASFLSRCSVTLFCYSTNPHVKDRQRHQILIRPGVSHIAFCCKGVSARELSSIAFGETQGWKCGLVEECFWSLVESENPLIVLLTVLLQSVLGIIQIRHPKNLISASALCSFPESSPLLSLSLLPPRLASITMREATSPLTALSM